MYPSVAAGLAGVIVQRGRRRGSGFLEQQLGELERGEQISAQALELHQIGAFAGVLGDRGLDGGKRVSQLAPAPEAVESSGGIVASHRQSVAVPDAGRLTSVGQFARDRAAVSYSCTSFAAACGTPAAA